MALSILERFLLKHATIRSIDGILVVANDGQKLDRVLEALRLVRQHDPIRYRRIAQDIARIWVTLLPGSLGQFDERTWTCKLDERFVVDEETTPELIASVIVHEATHARLQRSGIGYGEDLRMRVEEFCLRQEIVFATKLPNGAQAIEWAERTLEAMPDMSNQAMVSRGREGAEKVFRHLGVPEWLIRIIAATACFLHRR